MSPIEIFKCITEKGSYKVGYLIDGGTREINIEAKCPSEGMMKVQTIIGSICCVTFIERM